MNTETQQNLQVRSDNEDKATTRPQSAQNVRWFRPAVDVLERAEGLVLLFDLPGVEPKQIEVQTEESRLTVKGVRTDGERGWHRVLTMPPAYNLAGIEAKAENGVLVLTVPKHEAARPRRIEVR
jgi:HSP20 family protein